MRRNIVAELLRLEKLLFATYSLSFTMSKAIAIYKKTIYEYHKFIKSLIVNRINYKFFLFLQNFFKNRKSNIFLWNFQALIHHPK
jgi:hypothetical protein